ncbi:MAG TPA: DUF2165 domain-containing protein [Chthoniobacterales bacterium]
MLLRLAKIALVLAVAVNLSIVVLNNLTDYDSNLNFVLHVLAMDSTFPGNKLMWRAITNPAVHHAFYISIITWETVSAALLWIGAIRCLLALKASATEFASCKEWIIGGLTLSLLQWFFAFITIGGEWFAMWQSEHWNGQDAAFRMFACLGIILLFVTQREADPID